MRSSLLLLGLTSVVLLSVAQAEEEEIFGLTRRHDIQITVSADDYKKMDPPPPAMNRPPAAGPGRPAPGSLDFGAGNFDFEFTYVKAKVTLGDDTLDNVGLRYKGSGTYLMSGRQAKRSFKLDFDRFDEDQRFRGVKKLNLNSGVMDPTKAREVLAYRVFAALDLPACRTALAQVNLTVPGVYDRELLGVYTVVEQVDKKFLKAHFGSDKGLLLKPEGIRGLPHFGDDYKVYEASYLPKTEGTEEQWRKLVDLTRLINLADEAQFREQIGNHLDLENVAQFVAANTALASLDGFLGLGHNYYLYLSPQSGKFAFIPWDLDLAFGAFPMYGSPSELVDLSIEHPYVGDSKLLDRLLKLPGWKAQYLSHLRRLSDEVFTADHLGRDLKQLDQVLKPLIDREQAAAKARKENASPGGGLFGSTPVPLGTFIEKRKASIDNQLAGKAKGFVPRAFGGFGPPPPPNPGQQVSQALVRALDSNKDSALTEEELAAGLQRLSSDWDRNQNGKLEEQELTEGLQRLLPRPGGPMSR